MKFELVVWKCILSLKNFTPIARSSKMNLKLLLYLIVSFLQLFDIIMAIPDVNIDQNISMAQCRAVCIQKFTSQYSSSREDECNKKTDCEMCWNSCRMFQGNIPAKSTLCRDPTACFPGCQAACQFYEDSASKNLTPPFSHQGANLVAYMAPPKLLKDGQLVWESPLWSRGGPPPQASNDIVIYIVMTKVNGIWNQHTQTAATKSILPTSVKESEVRVFAVTPSGLVAYAEPTDDKSTKRSSFDGDMKRDSESYSTAAVNPPSGAKNGGENGHVEIGNEASYFDSDVPYNDYNSVPDQEPPSVPIDHSWEINLDLLSMDLLASVEVSWDYRGSESVDYLVSWTESSGGISGHMVTKQDRVEISLWSGQHYSIQVELLDQHGNSVLRSMPKTISFGSPEPSVSATSTPAPKRNLTTTVRSTTTTTFFTFSTVGYPPIIRRKDYNPDFSVGKEDRDAILRDSQKHLFPERSSTSTASYSEIPPWKNEASYNHVTLSNSRKDATLPQTPQGGTSSQLMTWAACLGVGAVVILILIIWAVRTLRKSTTAREDNRRAEDYLSETTASSVNSSNITTCSHLSRGSRVGRESEEPPWTYETFYRVNNTPLTIQALQRPPPPPLHSPPSPPVQHVHTVVPIQGSMGIPFSHHSHQLPMNTVQHLNQLPLNTHVSSMPLSQISLGTHTTQVTPSSSGVTHAIAVSTPISVNPSLVNLSNRNCCGNL